MNPHEIHAEHAPDILHWIKTRCGVAVWRNRDLSNPGSWTCPLNDEQGNPMPKPYPIVADKPEHIITSTDDLLARTDHEVARFHVAVCMGTNGLKVKLTDATEAEVKKALEEAGPDAYHAFDEERQDAIIMAPDGQTVTLTQWAKEHQ